MLFGGNVEVLDSLILLQEISRDSSRGWHDLIDITGHIEDFFLIICFFFFLFSYWVKFPVVYRRVTERLFNVDNHKFYFFMYDHEITGN